MVRRHRRTTAAEQGGGQDRAFSDGSTREIDAIILCTGYQHCFPFIEDSLRLRTANVLYPRDLHRGVFWVDNTKMMYIGMQDQYYTFTLFDVQAWYARDFVLGRLTLPPGRRCSTTSPRGVPARMSSPTRSRRFDFQADHPHDLSKETDYPDFDLDLTRDHFKKWEHDKEDSIIGYRDRAFSSPCTGTMATVHHTPWWVEPDDSMATFLGAGPSVS